MADAAFKGDEPAAEFFIYTTDCQIDKTEPTTPQDHLRSFVENQVQSVAGEDGVVIEPHPSFAVQNVPVTSDRQHVFGYFFQWSRSYDNDRVERLTHMLDDRRQDNKCAAVKMNIERYVHLTPQMLAGRVLRIIQESLQTRDRP